jgi:hypothetical protein
MRRQPYTERGIRRVPCARCGQPSRQQWRICADGQGWRGLCNACDIELNRLVLIFIADPNAGGKITDYARRLAEEGNHAD